MTQTLRFNFWFYRILSPDWTKPNQTKKNFHWKKLTHNISVWIWWKFIFIKNTIWRFGWVACTPINASWRSCYLRVRLAVCLMLFCRCFVSFFFYYKVTLTYLLCAFVCKLRFTLEPKTIGTWWWWGISLLLRSLLIPHLVLVDLNL